MAVSRTQHNDAAESVHVIFFFNGILAVFAHCVTYHYYYYMYYSVLVLLHTFLDNKSMKNYPACKEISFFSFLIT